MSFKKIIDGLRQALSHARGETTARISYGDQIKGTHLRRFTKCLHCGSTSFFEGPQGGASQNVFCSECGAGYNIHLIPGGPFLDQEIRLPTKDTTRA